jgi:hypothetical protein
MAGRWVSGQQRPSPSGGPTIQCGSGAEMSWEAMGRSPVHERVFARAAGVRRRSIELSEPVSDYAWATREEWCNR